MNAANGVRAIPRADLSAMFLRQRTTWQDGSAVHPVDQEPASAVRALFTHEVHRRPISAIQAYWRQQIFAHGQVPPVERAGDAQVLEWVRKSPGAVGYVSTPSAGAAGVHAVDVTP